MFQLTPIIAAGWIEWVGPIIVFILYALGSLATNKGNKPPPPQQRMPKPRGPAAPPPPPRTLEEKLRNEVEEFLRQVQGDQPKPARPGRPVGAPRPLVVKAAPTPVESSELELSHESVQEHVARHVNTADIAQHTATLGAVVGQTDERLESHLQEKFQHHVGALEPRQKAGEPRRRQNTAAAEIAQLLRSPGGMRQVIIASEILRRPEI